jgi:hypothetical protein
MRLTMSPSPGLQGRQTRGGSRGRGLGTSPLGGGLTSDTFGRGSHRCRLTSDLLRGAPDTR